jgi:peptide/nickel transport system permease protein
MSIIVFVAGRASLASPRLAALGLFAPEKLRDEFDERFHLDEPLVTQYGLWLQDAVRGDFGTSFVTRQPVSEIMKSGAVVTLELAAGALALTVVIGVGTGIVAGMSRSRAVQHTAAAGTVASMSIPSFVLGLIMILLFAQWLHVLPPGGYVSPSVDPIANIQGMLLPWFTLALAPAGLLARIVQVRVREEASRPHVLTARGLGVRESRIRRSYVLRNALTEPITVIGLTAGYLIGGAVLTERVFNLPGLGAAAVNATNHGDYPVVQAVALFATLAFLLISLLVDLLHLRLDVTREAN